MSHYDFIIMGAGAAGLLLADALGKDAFFASKSILILEKGFKSQNDRTWCYWEKGKGDFDSLIHKKWDNIYVAGKKLRLSTSIAPYAYKMIQGIDFYKYYVSKVKSYTNVTWVQEQVDGVEENENTVLVKTEKNVYSGEVIFNSIFDSGSLKQQKEFPVLQQHFLGWFIQTEKPVFDPEKATFMDFSIPQKGNTRFMYVLPFSESEALVEYTLFSEKLLKKEVYEKAIASYMVEEYNNVSYQIMEKEFGTIPMTCYPFHKRNTERIFYIGIAGGWAKPSTGFTFYNTSKQVKALVDHLKQDKSLTQFHKKNRFHFYDMLLLDVLSSHNHKGRSIFESLFKKRKASLILKFLDNETSIWEELKVMNACPKFPFLRALLNRMF
ncbi:lycopene cyclase [Muricauda sp. JGD-17]|uniref:Lycopene cyclase n=1 Tax=Flagellimonas ochracea TaxID=2696472 RepID=A0A964WWW9_9FLAO|nr:lycopene cyclase family protein [Allomuricauda ochracea]NAY91450.1 lycopene cyclase [Allomuricauda ochracea]